MIRNIGRSLQNMLAHPANSPFLATLMAALVTLTSQNSAAAGDDVRQKLILSERAKLEENNLRQINSVKAQDPTRLITLAFSEHLIQVLLNTYTQSSLTIGALKLQVTQISFSLDDGVPLVSSNIRASTASQTVDLAATATLDFVVEGSQIKIRARILDLRPEGSSSLPEAISAAISGDVPALTNAQSPDIILPYQQQITIPVSPLQQYFDLDLPLANGSVTVRITTPATPNINRWLEPLAVLFHDNELVVYGLALSHAPEAHAPNEPGTNSGLSAVDNSKTIPNLALEGGQDFAWQVGSGVILDLFSEVNRWSAAERTLSLHGLSAIGNIISRTGGLPFGGGIGTSVGVSLKPYAPNLQDSCCRKQASVVVHSGS